MSAAGIDLGRVMETVADFWNGESLTDFLTKLRHMQDEEKRRVEAEERAIRAEREGTRLRQALTQLIEDLPSQMQEKVSDFAIHRVIQWYLLNRFPAEIKEAGDALSAQIVEGIISLAQEEPRYGFAVFCHWPEETMAELMEVIQKEMNRRMSQKSGKL